MCRELVATVLNMFKKFMRIVSPKYFARLLLDCRASVANLSPLHFGEFILRIFRDTRTNAVRVSHDGRATVLRKHADTSRLSGEKKTKRHSYKCRATLARIRSRDCRTN